MSGFASLSQLVQSFESGGNYTATNSKSTASGAYQIINSTWDQYAPLAGVDTSQYPTAASAPPNAQDAVFSQIVTANGLNDWTCPGCNPQLSQYLAANPSAAALPISTGTPAGAGASSATTPATQTTTPPTTATTTATPSASASFYVIAIILVIFLLAAGLWGLVKG